jgi:hypothetical protein
MEQFSLANEHGDDIVFGTLDYDVYIRGVAPVHGLLSEAVRIAFSQQPENDDELI